MKTILSKLASKLIALAFPGAVFAPTHPINVKADVATTAIATEVAVVYGDLPARDQEVRARASLVWGWYEAALESNPKCAPGPKCNDDGSACGFGQVHLAEFPKGTFPPEMTCAAIRADLRTSVRAQLIAMRFFENKCGSLRGGLTAYSTNGACPAKGWTIPLVIKRCKEAGLTEACTLPEAA